MPAPTPRRWRSAFPPIAILNTAVDGRYRIEKEVLTDPWRDVVLQRVRFVPLEGTLADFRLYVLLAPHLANRGSGNTAWVGDYKGMPMLLAERDGLLRWRWPPRRRGWRGRLGLSACRMDGRNCTPTNAWRGPTLRAENGNVAVTGEIDLRAADGIFRARARLRADSRWKPGSTRSSVCSRISTPHRRSTSGRGRPGTTTLRTACHGGHELRSITSVPRYCARTNPSAWKAASSPACRFPGASPRATTTWAAITWLAAGPGRDRRGFPGRGRLPRS